MMKKYMSARKMRKAKRLFNFSIFDLRVLLGGMCVLSFLLTFLYVDDFSPTADGRLISEDADLQEEDFGGTEDADAEDIEESGGQQAFERPEVPVLNAEEEALLLHDEEDEGVMEPEVLTIQPFHGPPSGGMLVSIHGHNLRGTRGYGNPKVFIGGVPCNATTVVDHEELTCITPPGVGGRLSVRVIVHNLDPHERGQHGERLPGVLQSKDNTLFSYDEPTVDSVVPDHSRTSGGTRVTITGSNFGMMDPGGDIEATIAGVPCLQTMRVSDKECVCVTPPGTAGAKGVMVGVGSGEHRVDSPRVFLFAYIMTPGERLNSEADSLLDGLTVRYDPDSVSLVMHKKELASSLPSSKSSKASGIDTFASSTTQYEYNHKDLFTGRSSSYSVPPDLLAVLPESDLARGMAASCAVVGNSGSLLDASHGKQIDKATYVFRFNNAPTAGFENHVGSKTDFRVVQTRFLRSLLSRDPADRKRGWRPDTKQNILVWSHYAQDIYVQVARVFQRMSIFYVSRGLVGNVRTLYAELRFRFEDLGVSSSLKMNAQDMAAHALGGAPAGKASSAQLGNPTLAEVSRRMRHLLQEPALVKVKELSMERLEEIDKRPDQGLQEVEPRGTPEEPPLEFIATTFALQMCEKVHLYGFEPFEGGGQDANGEVMRHSRVGPYYTRQGLDKVFGIEDGFQVDDEERAVQNAILELLRIKGFVETHI